MKTSKRKALRDLIARKEVIMAPGAYDALSARLIQAAGFEMVGTTGYGMHGSILGVPDNGMLAFNEMVAMCGNMANAIDIPMMADAEGGYGNATNTIRTVQEFERAGVAGIFIEDQQLPPNCPFIKKPTTISVEEMCGKIRAACDARQDPDFVICARTDAPFDEAIERAKEYLKAGADMIKIIPKTRQELEILPTKLSCPLHLGFFTNSDQNAGLTAWDAGKMGYTIVTFPLTPLFIGTKAIYEGLKKIKEQGNDEGVVRDMMMPFAEYLKIVDVDKYIEYDKRYGAGEK